MDVGTLLVPYIVFLVFSAVAIWARGWIALATFARWPLKLSAKERHRLKEQTPYVRGLAAVAAVGAGVMAIGITIQEILGIR